jgi:hypothetical protein
MKLFRPISTSPSRGFSLIITMCFLAALLMVFVSMLSWSSSNAMLTERNNLYNQTQMAAEAATENTLASMISDFDNNGVIGVPSHYNTSVPNTTNWPVQYAFFDASGTSNHVTVSVSSAPWGSIPAQFNQLSGIGNNYSVTAQAVPVGQRYSFTNRVTQSIWAGQIPLYQFAIFYNMEMEINPGNNMTVNGRVHSNQDIYSSGAGGSTYLTFGGSVDAANQVYSNSGPWHSPPPRVGNVNFSNAPQSQVGTIYVPVGAMTNNNPTNVLAILNQPPTAYNPSLNPTAAYSTNGMVYYENAVDLVISNSANGVAGTRGTNITVYYQNPLAAQALTAIPPDVTNNSGTNVYKSYSFVTNGSFYDYREGATVQSVDIDVGKLNTWLSGAGSTYDTQNTTGSTAKALNHHINSIYVINQVQNNVSQRPSVRMLDGQQLPSSGLTVATAMPMYVEGNYNVTTNGTAYSTTLGDVANTQGASLLADALTLLSSNWSDAYNTNTALSSRNPSDTTLNAATLEGIVPSTITGTTTNYSGGVENFLRLLENWSAGNTVTYNGSIVVMFPSQYATNGWSVRPNTYSVPTRAWGFDVNFTSPNGLPPLTPQATRLFRTTWSPN